MTAIMKKELKTYFTGINGYVFVGVFLLISAFFFGVNNVDTLTPNYGGTFLQLLNVFVILSPVLTMRLFAEERRQKTDQLLFTSPLKISGIVIGKYLASLAVYAVSLASTLLFPLVMSFYTDKAFPWGETICAFLGFFLLGTCFIAVGIFVSSLTESQSVAAIATAAALYALVLLIGNLAASAPRDRFSSGVFIGIVILCVAGLLYYATKKIVVGAIAAAVGIALMFVILWINPALFDGVIYKVLNWFSLMARFMSFYSGILNIADIVYYITFSAAFIFMTVYTIEKRRWR